jgi:hypothetical protein
VRGDEEVQAIGYGDYIVFVDESGDHGLELLHDIHHRLKRGMVFRALLTRPFIQEEIGGLYGPRFESFPIAGQCFEWLTEQNVHAAGSVWCQSRLKGQDAQTPIY